MKTQIPQEQLKEIQNFLFEGQKIQAIKVHREATGSGLKEAKEAVEAIESKLREQAPESFQVAPKSAGCSAVILAALVPLGVLAVWLNL